MAVFIFGRSGSPLIFNENFVDNSWEGIARACQMNKVPDTWKVGDSKPMTIKGAHYQIDIIGKMHDSYADGTGLAPLTFQVHDCYGGKGYIIDSSGVYPINWHDCQMRISTLPAILAEMPEEIGLGIREVNKLTGAHGNPNTLVTTVDKLFLLSETEVLGYDGYYNRGLQGEGTQYEYYLKGGSRKKTLNGTTDWWWTRTPQIGDNYKFRSINSDGTYSSTMASSNLGLSFAFCF